MTSVRLGSPDEWQAGDGLRAGARIMLVAPMRDEPDPVEPGTAGTVTYVNRVAAGTPQAFVQLSVAWDNGRSLGLCIPPDRIAVVR